tara:strand:- start:13288 stop:13956 length:669 start_codon:yes stop_codon:yes gene_type:complete
MLQDFQVAHQHQGYHCNSIWKYKFEHKNILQDCENNFDKFLNMNKSSGNLKNYISDDRYYYPNGNSVKPIDNFLSAFEDSVREWITNTVHDKKVFDPFIQPSWPFAPHEWLDYMNITSHIMVDNNGYNMGVHEDSNKVVCNFIANISENSCGTKFYHPVFENEDNWKSHFNGCKNKVVYEAPGEAGTGICWFNSRGSLHSINVDCDKRFTAMASIRLNFIKY